jgi:hypothetical protein
MATHVAEGPYLYLGAASVSRRYDAQSLGHPASVVFFDTNSLKDLAATGVILGKKPTQIMKTYLLLFFIGTLSFNLAIAQPVNLSVLPTDRPLTKADLEKALAPPTNSLPRFDLDFPGGMPGDLVKAIEKVTDKRLNTIIPAENADVKLPALSVRNVTVVELFQALERATTRTERFAWTDYVNVNREPQTGSPVTFYYDWTVREGFRTDGTPTENSIWSFCCDRPSLVQHDPVLCRFYLLAPYLDAGYRVEDIISTVDNGWKMLGVTQRPEITYHKDTKVLIAVGEADKLKTIDDVLKQLKTEKSSEKSKTQ